MTGPAIQQKGSDIMFDNLRLNTKLIGSTLGVALMAGLLAWASMSGLDAAQDQLKVLFGQSQKQRLAAEVDSNFQLAISKAKNFVILKDDANRDKAAKYFSDLQASYKQLLPLAATPEEKKIFEQIGVGINSVEPHLLRLLSTAKASDKAEDLYEANLKGVTAQFDDAIGSYVTALDEKTGQELAARIRRTELTLLLCLGLVVAGLAVSLAVSLGVSKSLEQMISALNEGVNQVASGSNQVAGSSQQLAEGASESASSLEETSSSMEEMASMTRQNSENAARANKLMDETRALVGKGSEAVEGTLKSMSEMNESAEKVSRIIKTIEEIAFQTNLLALNAAVEAARAGEHGRGFAVVAEEVRNLASRSAAAARDTAALIEENARRAGTGMQVSSEAGRSLREIVESSSKVASLVGEIAAASQEQSRGIGEINGAISQMDKVTQRVTANAEELSSASEEMSGQASSLRDMVRRLVRMVEGSNADLQTAPAPVAPKASYQAPAFKAPRSNGNGNGGHSKPLTLGRNTDHETVLPLGLAELRQF
jgi:methyl-accepting chemotaxis protein